MWDGVPRIHEVLTGHCAAGGNKQYVQEIARKFSSPPRAADAGLQRWTRCWCFRVPGHEEDEPMEALAGAGTRRSAGRPTTRTPGCRPRNAWFVELSELASMGSPRSSHCEAS